ncbi:Serine/threonine protein phosphatase PrpC [Pseudobutyrivibrio sp. 49]|uniref:PP2C family protein-serine/threonine phosphatase n=1 Tax=Pseudobutyrivibrio sp. 49 TaxID=1855344 RepID=UPI000891F23A|nr:PP2C family serine/threonine-protein phosphatase [Pseudobutyrivibrio sp. 49]SDI35664.1 Serine/threonine protein phosphatase PrpC [Pseudobutyrivibrio sp. 49]
MGFKVDAYSDIGTKKSVNQDALLIKQAKAAGYGNICMGVLCDGMGGLSCGEVASSAFVNRMDTWFKTELPQLLLDRNITEPLKGTADISSTGHLLTKVEGQWKKVVTEMNDRLKVYGNENGIRLGTTVVAIIIVGEEYMTMNVGDSRAYRFNKKQLAQVSHDHSYVQQQLELGRMTEAEALASDKKSVLLQCIGASESVSPDFFTGKIENNMNFLLCSDGLWRKLVEKEIMGIAPQRNGIKKLTEMVMKRGETDNISGLIISI